MSLAPCESLDDVTTERSLHRGLQLLSVPPPRSTETDICTHLAMAVIDPVFTELLEEEGEEKRGIWRVQKLELVAVPKR